MVTDGKLDVWSADLWLKQQEKTKQKNTYWTIWILEIAYLYKINENII